MTDSPTGIQTQSTTVPRPSHSLWWLLAFVCLLVVVILGRRLPLAALTLRVAADLRGHGLTGVMTFVTLYVCAEIVMVPGALLTMAAGFVYGVWGGVALAVPASVCAAGIGFLLARTALRERIRARLERSAHLDAIRAAVADHSLAVVVLLRLSPVVPFNVANYAMGLTDVSLSRFLLASFIGMIPSACVYAYMGSVAPALLSGAIETSHTSQLALAMVGAITAFAAVFIIGRAARERLAARGQA